MHQSQAAIDNSNNESKAINIIVNLDTMHHQSQVAIDNSDQPIQSN